MKYRCTALRRHSIFLHLVLAILAWLDVQLNRVLLNQGMITISHCVLCTITAFLPTMLMTLLTLMMMWEAGMTQVLIISGVQAVM